MPNGANGPFFPQVVNVVVGVNNTIRWINNDPLNQDHTVTSDGGAAVFDSGNLTPGDTFICTLNTPGTYNYHCSYHPFMVGTIIVKAP